MGIDKSRNTLRLRGEQPLIREALEVGSSALLVYVLLWESAEKHHGKYSGGTTTWSHSGLAKELKLGKATVLGAINGLLDAGLIQRAGVVPPQGKGTWKQRYRVTHPQMLSAQRYAISVMGPPSERPVSRGNPTLNHDNRDYAEVFP